MIHKNKLSIINHLALFLNLAWLGIALGLFLFPFNASAQNKCGTLDNNTEWISGMQQLIETIKTEDMPKAKLQAKALADICADAPTLNYLQGKIAEALGEKQDALYYYQKASENTYTFAIDPDNAKKIWYARYENEHPERTASALASNSESMSALEAKNARLEEINAQHLESYKKLLWAGVGIGAGGLVLAGTGAALVAMSHSSKFEKPDDDLPYKVSDDPMHATGWVFTGLGSGLLLTGAILAGIYGHKYKQPLDDNFTFNISPNRISFSMKF